MLEHLAQSVASRETFCCPTDLPLGEYTVGTAQTLTTFAIKTQLINDRRNDLLRLVASMQCGHSTASLLIAKRRARTV